MALKKIKLNNRKKVVLTLALLLVVLLGLVGSFAWFSSNISNKNQTAELKTGTMRLKFADNDSGINKQMIVGESVVKKFTITNTGTLDASLSLDFKDLVNTYMNGSLSYNLTYSETEDGEYKTLIEETNMPVSSDGLTQTIASEISVPGDPDSNVDVTYYYNLTITYNSTDQDQASEHDAIFTTGFDVGQPVKYRYYTLTVDPNGGSWGEYTTPQTYQLQNNDTKDITGTPTKTGYTFVGWKLKGVSSTFENNTFTMGISNASLTAEWIVNTHTITIDPVGGAYSGDTTFSLDYGSSTTISTPTKEGYTFNGWTVSGGSLSNNTFTLTEDKDVTLTATWTINSYKYTVIHRQMNTDGTTYTEVETENLTANYGETKTPEVKTYTGFTSPSTKTITIGTNETQNVVTYDYTRNQYSLTIKPNKGSYNGTTSNTVIDNIYYGATYSLKTPTRDGHTFVGWETDAGAISSDNTTFTMSDAQDSTIIANWSANSYDYTVNHKRQASTGGDNYSIIDRDNDIVKGTGVYGSDIPLTQKTYTSFTYHGLEEGSATTISSTAENNVANLLYDRDQYQLTIDPNGGSYNGSTSSTVETMYYEASKTLTDPERVGYTFNGWSKSGSGTLSGSTFTMGSGVATLTANWTINSYGYTINYYQENANDSSYTLKDTVTGSGTYQSSITVDESKYTSTQFTYSSRSGATTVGVNETENVVNVYYDRQTYTLTIDPNEGSSTTSTTLKYGQTYTLPTPTKTGYSYTWSVSGTGSSISGSTFTMGTAATTVTATWSANTYTVTFNANGGTPTTSTKNIAYNSNYSFPSDPTYEGYNFLGWYTAKDGGTQVTTSTVMTTAGAHTLYAHWEVPLTSEVRATLSALGKTAKTGSPTFSSKATTDETSDGLYALTDDYGTSLYYRGAVEDNYVKFAGFYWRIIRINGDGSIRMIYDGTVAHQNGGGASTFTTTGVDGSTASSNRFTLIALAWNTTNYNDAKYVGYMYGGANGTASTSLSGAQTNETDTNIKTQLESWYSTNLTQYDKYISDEVFCNDRSLGSSDSTYTNLGYGTNPTSYAARMRFYSRATGYTDGTPTFECAQANDMFTKTAQAVNGKTTNGKLSQKVGLITADEIVAAGGKYDTTNRYYYLYKSSNYWYWSLSPLSVGSSGYANVFSVMTGGALNSYNVNAYGAVAPVINLSAEYSATITGSGTTSDPYQIALGNSSNAGSGSSSSSSSSNW